MTPKQFFTRFQAWLKSMVWEGTTNKIFGDGVYVVPELPIEQLVRYPKPCIFVLDSGAIPHPQHPGILEQRFQVIIFVDNVQDGYGQGVILGACRIANTSRGAGILDIEEELLPQLHELTDLTTKIMLVEKSSVKQVFLKKNAPLLFRNITFTVLLGLY